MQLVYDVEKLNKDGSMKLIKRFDTMSEAKTYASELLRSGEYKEVGIVPVMVDDDFSNPTKLSEQTIIK